MRKAHTLRSTPLSLLAAAALGCDGTGGRTASFVLTIRPVPPPSQADLFDGIETLLVRISDSSGVLDEYELAVERGSAPAIEELAALPEDVTIELEGLRGSGAQQVLVARGRSAPLSVGRKEQASVDVFIAALGEMATFNELELASWGTAVASDGEGHFYAFGGVDGGIQSTAVDAISRWSLVPPAADFQPAVAAGFPTTADDWGSTVNEITGRAHASATLLAEGTHADIGKILVTGGWSSFQGSESVTAQAFLFDPAADPAEAIEVLEGLKTGRAMHAAVPLGSGEVVFFGGYSHIEGPYIDGPITIEVYDPVDREFSYGSNMTDRRMVDGAASRLGDDALYCGGLEWGNGEYGAFGDCIRVDRFGNVAMVGAPAALDDAGLVLPAMAELQGSRALLAGGVEVEGTVDDSDWQDASARCFTYDADDGTWREVANMKVARAGHVATSLPDGRVLVAGGAPRLRLEGLEFEDPLPCAEVYDPGENAWTLLDSACAAGSDAGDLPTGLYRPSVAVDPYQGVAIWGGQNLSLGRDPEAQPYNALFVPEL